MNRLIKFIIIVTGIGIAVSSGYFYVIGWGLKRSKAAFPYKIAKLFEERNIYNTVFLGSSRSFNGINPILFDKKNNVTSFNYGFSAANMEVITTYTKKILQQKNIPKNFVFTIDVFTFENSKTDKLFYYPVYFPYMNDSVIYAMANIEPTLKTGYYFPFYGVALYDDYLKTIGINAIINPDNKDEIYYQRGFEAIIDSTYRGEEDITSLNFSIDTNEYLRFDTLCNMLHNKGCSIIFILAPYYNSLLPENENRAKFYALLNQLKSKYNCTVIDLFTDMRFTKKMFYNRSHLNRQGAEFYTNIIADTLAPYMIK